jgi:serine/threonine protein kinase
MALAGSIAPNAAKKLEGQTLVDGWKVISRLRDHPGATGGTASVGYLVEHPDGRQGFCKALDYAKAFSNLLTADALHRMTEKYIFERDIHRKCSTFRMSKIVTALADGSITIEGCPIPRVDYIIFELADSDIRHQLDLDPDLEARLRLRALHNINTAIQQLHAHDIAHQDVKPSNVLVCTEGAARKVNKLGDLGSATDASRPASHDGDIIPGDDGYAPPEQLYRHIYHDFATRRCASDLYQLGSLVTFMFSGVSMNALLFAELDSAYLWFNWRGSYDEILPYLESAFGNVLGNIQKVLPKELSDELIEVIRYLCEPNPERRGHPDNRKTIESRYGLQRVVTQFDRLVRKAELSVLAER